MRNVAQWNPQYHQYILSLDPIAYWIQDEKQGAVAHDMVTARDAGAQNGAYTGVTLGQPGIGDGRTSPYYDGLNDYTDVFTAALAAAFNASAGTMHFWARVAGAGVWTDGIGRWLIRFSVNNNNRVEVLRTAGNNQLRFRYEANTVDNTLLTVGLGGIIDWFSAAITWDTVADEVRCYTQGIQFGATLNGLGGWLGAINLGLIGALTAVPTFIWLGYLAHVALYGRALTPAQILRLYEQGVGQ